MTQCFPAKCCLFRAQDLDILVTHPEYRADNEKSSVHKMIKASLLHKLVDSMKRAKYVTDVLAEGESKFMVCCPLRSCGRVH
jgi:hypothetical protein